MTDVAERNALMGMIERQAETMDRLRAALGAVRPWIMAIHAENGTTKSKQMLQQIDAALAAQPTEPERRRP